MDSNISLREFANDFAEAIELKLLGSDVIDGIAWDDHAKSILGRYHESLTDSLFEQKPLWRELHEQISSLDPSTSVHIRYSRLIANIADQLEQEYGDLDAINLLREESTRAFYCE